MSKISLSAHHFSPCSWATTPRGADMLPVKQPRNSDPALRLVSECHPTSISQDILRHGGEAVSWAEWRPKKPEKGPAAPQLRSF